MAAAFYNKAADENCYLTADCLRQGCCKETVAYFSICTIFISFYIICSVIQIVLPNQDNPKVYRLAIPVTLKFK